jgi:tRNA pseudouridine38-40 synthase
VADLGGAGRTDAGVHALGQCAHLRLEQRVDPGELGRALNRRLPRDVHVLAVLPVDSAFHARHEALARSYLYQLSRRRTALAKPWVWWVREPLDLGRIREGAAILTGRHDFRHFAEIDPRSTESTLVEVERVEVAEEGALVLVRIVASHFLWKMVRRLIGTLAQLGAGGLGLGDLARLIEGAPLAAGDPRPAEWTAPPSGLFLERVLYAGDPPLPPIAATVKVAAAPAPSSSEQRPRQRARERRTQRPKPRPKQRQEARRSPARPGPSPIARRGQRSKPRPGQPPRPRRGPRRPG